MMGTLIIGLVLAAAALAAIVLLYRADGERRRLAALYREARQREDVKAHSYTAKVRMLETELQKALAAAPRYARDPRTGRFTKKAA